MGYLDEVRLRAHREELDLIKAALKEMAKEKEVIHGPGLARHIYPALFKAIKDRP